MSHPYAPVPHHATRATVASLLTVGACAALGTAAVVVPAPATAFPAVLAACIGLALLVARDAGRRAGPRPLATAARPPRLPQPDPRESPLALAPAAPLPAATVIFAAGPPSPATDHAAERLLELRPGLLVVVAQE